MDANNLSLLLVEDNPGDARLVRELLTEAASATFNLEVADHLTTGLARLSAGETDAVLLDLSLPDSQGLDTLFRMRAQAPHVPIVVLTGHEDETLGLELVQAGAQDYLVKGQVDANLLARSIRYAVQRKQAEEALRELNATLEQRVADRTHELTEANEKLKELDRLKDLFVSNVSHELRTPLTSILLQGDLLEYGKPEKREVYLSTLRRESNRLHKMIEDLLDLSRLDRAVTPVQPAPTDLNQLLGPLVADRTALSDQRSLVLEFEPAPDLPRALADPALLVQVVSNLLTNAMNYTPSGGSVRVMTGRQPYEAQDWITCTVCDTGPGISVKDLPHLFERFYRGEAGRKTSAPGTGLGLAISKEIIDRLGGRITVESEPVTGGSGAAFTVWLRPAL